MKTMRERFDEKFTSVWNSKHSEFIRIPDGIKSNMMDFIEQELKKERELKDQEHKTELESIKGEIKDKIIGQNAVFNSVMRNKLEEATSINKYNEGIKDSISILDSHINKLSTE